MDFKNTFLWKTFGYKCTICYSACNLEQEIYLISQDNMQTYWKLSKLTFKKQQFFLKKSKLSFNGCSAMTIEI
jgi:hypothetical protein